MKSLHKVIAKCVLFLHLGQSAVAWEKSIASEASPNNHIIREERTTSLKSYDTLLVSSDIPVTIQRYKGDATLPARGNCEEHPLGEDEGIILVTSNCATSDTTVIPSITLGEVANEWGGGSSVNSIKITLDVLSADEMASMNFLEPSSYTMERSHTDCTEIYCGENPWGTIEPTQIAMRPTISPTGNPSASPTSNPTVNPTHSPTKEGGAAVVGESEGNNIGVAAGEFAVTGTYEETERPAESTNFESLLEGSVNLDAGEVIGAGENADNDAVIDGTKIIEQSDPEDYATEENSACSPQSVVFGFLALAKGAHSKVVSVDNMQQQARALDTCAYNAEIFINGCAYDRMINITAPNVRVADANATFTEVITTIDEKMSEFNETVDFTFPKEQMSNMNAASDEVVQVEEVDASCYCCSCAGRPFVDASGSKLQAMPVVVNDITCSLAGDDAGGSNDDKSKPIEYAPTQNELILGKEWTQSALGEHASIASFSAFSIALMTNGAPSDLVEDALKAGLDEVRHAKVSFDIASKLTGSDAISPGPLPRSTHIFQQNLTAMAMAVAREGCIDETLSALVAAAEFESINTVLESGPGMNKYLNITESTLIWIRDELHKIALDESNHSALAWRTVKWVCSVDAEACSAVREAVLEKKKMAIAFHRRFDSLDIHEGALMNLLAAWSKISTILESLNIDAGGDKSNVNVCAKSDLENTSLVNSLVDNILKSVTCSSA